MKKRIWRQCKRKHRYRDEHSANYYRRVCERQRGIKLDYYWCCYCNGFHLTSADLAPALYGLDEEMLATAEG